MKGYEVILGPRAKADLEMAYRRIAEDSEASAHQWYRGCLLAMKTLEASPRRCGLAPESEAFKTEIRQLLHGSRSKPYRILFTIEGRRVYVLHVRNGARDWLSEAD